MAIDLSYSPEVVDLVARTQAFIAEHVAPVEEQFHGDITAAGGDDLRRELNAKAKAAGIFAPHAPVEYGGLGLNMSDRSPVFTAAGHSTFGPVALHIGAPDEGNVHMLSHIASDAQRDKYLGPLATGEVRSGFAMTEPAPTGAGSDPNCLSTTAVKADGGWKINGRKRFITGADGAGFYIIMARTSGSVGDRGGATMFLAPGDTPGISVDRHVHTIDKAMIGGHCEMTFADVFVPDEDVLGEVDEGYRYAQVRLGPARMTHVMRWLGSAERAHAIAVDYVRERDGFGGKLADLGMIQQMIADFLAKRGEGLHQVEKPHVGLVCGDQDDVHVGHRPMRVAGRHGITAAGIRRPVSARTGTMADTHGADWFRRWDLEVERATRVVSDSLNRDTQRTADNEQFALAA